MLPYIINKLGKFQKLTYFFFLLNFQIQSKNLKNTEDRLLKPLNSQPLNFCWQWQKKKAQVQVQGIMTMAIELRVLFENISLQWHLNLKYW